MARDSDATRKVMSWSAEPGGVMTRSRWSRGRARPGADVAERHQVEHAIGVDVAHDDGIEVVRLVAAEQLGRHPWPDVGTLPTEPRSRSVPIPSRPTPQDFDAGECLAEVRDIEQCKRSTIGAQTLHPKEDRVRLAPRIGSWKVAADGSVTLVGSHCTTCRENLFPARPVCSRCGKSTLEEARFRGPAKLLSYTVVHQAPSGYPKPMTVGYGVLPDELVVFAPIEAPSAALHKGVQLELVEGVTSTEDDGSEFRSYRYRATDTTHA